MKLDFSEIKNWKEFEELVAAYFRQLNDEDNNFSYVNVELSGEGSDGGIDILVTFEMRDAVVVFKRRWVVQCKFYEKSVSKSHISDINIPTLIHQKGAVGYLLICKNDVTSGLKSSFKELNDSCPFGYKYMIWNGSEFADTIINIDKLLHTYFPKYYKYKLKSKSRLK